MISVQILEYINGMVTIFPNFFREDPSASPLPGSDGRIFDFLGLLNCSHEACKRDNLPARKVCECLPIPYITNNMF